MDLRPGGVFQIVMQALNGETYPQTGRFLEVDEDESFTSRCARRILRQGTVLTFRSSRRRQHRYRSRIYAHEAAVTRGWNTWAWKTTLEQLGRHLNVDVDVSVTEK